MAGLDRALWMAIAGIVAFMALERTLVWRHCHDAGCDRHSASTTMVIFGDGLHNALDGVAIGAACLVSPELGLSTAIAVLAHELPQEIGDFAVLVRGGLSFRRALAWNLASSAMAIAGAVIAVTALPVISTLIPAALAFASGGLLYVALADVIPSIQAESRRMPLPVELGALAAGIAVTALAGH